MPQGHFAGSKVVSLGSTGTPGLCAAAFRLAVPQHVLLQGPVPPQVQGFALPLLEPHAGPVSPFLQPVQAPLLGSTTLRRMSLSSQFRAICKLSEGTLCPIIHITEWEQDPRSAAQGVADVHFDMTELVTEGSENDFYLILFFYSIYSASPVLIPASY